MGPSVAQVYLSDVLHAISQALLVPVILILIAFIAYALFSIGSIVSEFFTERRHFKVVMPKFLAALMSADQDEVVQVIEESGLINTQKKALLTVYDYRALPGDALIALIKRLVSEEESRYERIRARNNVAARISPMVGLMGTLIPLGPGIEALGRADTAALSSSLLIAFDTTVAGLVVAAVCLAIGKIRSNWYDDYLSALDAAMATMLEKIESMRDGGEITTKQPSDYAFLFERSGGKRGYETYEKSEPELEPVHITSSGTGASHSRQDDQSAKERSSYGSPSQTALRSTQGRAAGDVPLKLPAITVPATSPRQASGAAGKGQHDAEYHFEPPRQPWE